MKAHKLLFLLFFVSGAIAAQNYNQSTDVMLQGFNWNSHSNPNGWYNVVASKAQQLGNAEFDMVWLGWSSFMHHLY